jgi:ComEC/Rec2-related protein
MRRSTKILSQLLIRRPLLPFLAAMLLGQLLAQRVQLGGIALFAILLTNFLFLHALRKQLPFALQVLALGLVTGMASVCLHSLDRARLSEQFSLHPPPAQRYFAAQVVAPVRYPMPGASELQLLALERSAQLTTSGVDQMNPVAAASRPLRLQCRAVDLPWRNLNQPRSGDLFLMAATLSPLVEQGVSSYGAQLRRRQIDARCKVRFASKSLEQERMPWWVTLADLGEQHLYQIVPKDEISGLLLSISFGRRDLLSQRSEQSFRALGLSHVLVVSGFQVSLLYALSYWVFSLLLSCSNRLLVAARVRPWAALLGLFSSLFFVALCGFEASAVRALLAVSLVFLALFREHDTSLGQAILLSGLCLSALWPGCLFDIGMQLTFAALIGIWAGQALSGERGWSSLRTALYATLCPSLVAALWFQPLTLQGVFVNLLGAPLLASSICVATLIGLALSLSAIDSAGYFLQGVYWGMEQIRDLVWWLISPAQLQRVAGWSAVDRCLWVLLAVLVGYRVFLRSRERLLYPRV